MRHAWMRGAWSVVGSLSSSTNHTAALLLYRCTFVIDTLMSTCFPPNNNRHVSMRMYRRMSAHKQQHIQNTCSTGNIYITIACDHACGMAIIVNVPVPVT